MWVFYELDFKLHCNLRSTLLCAEPADSRRTVYNGHKTYDFLYSLYCKVQMNERGVIVSEQ